jgi:leucyl aminopeptidase (aminopeptidase T)
VRADERGARHLVGHCAGVRAGEHALLVCDRATLSVAETIAVAVRAVSAQAELVEVVPFAIHGQEPSGEVAYAMSVADVVFGVTTMSMAHTEARQRASMTGTRYLSLPDYSHEVLAGRALRADFRALTEPARRLAETFTAGHSVRLTSRAGTDVVLDIGGRTGNAAPGWCDGIGALASPPDAETNVALIEDSAEGVLVVDGSVPCAELGLLSTPLTLCVTAGRIRSTEGDAAAIFDRVIGRSGDRANCILAELGVGLNPLARVVGSMLEDEGALGTAHVGIGANTALGGQNRVSFHLDHVLCAPTLVVDGRVVMRDGCLLT